MFNPFDLRNSVVIVTGASSGIGQATSILLSKLGARVVLVSRSRDRLEETIKLLEGTDHCVEPFNLGNVDQIASFIKELNGKVGKIRSLVHCAGTQLVRPVKALSSAELEEYFKVNVVSSMMLAKAFRQPGCHQDDASIVFVSSVMGLVGAAGRSAYCANKGAIIALTKSLSLEFARDGIRVNCVAPAFVKTGMLNDLESQVSADNMARIKESHPLGFGEPLDVAYAITFLIAKTARWITGSCLVVDGGYTAH